VRVAIRVATRVAVCVAGQFSVCCSACDHFEKGVDQTKRQHSITESGLYQRDFEFSTWNRHGLRLVFELFSRFQLQGDYD